MLIIDLSCVLEVSWLLRIDGYSSEEDETERGECDNDEDVSGGDNSEGGHVEDENNLTIDAIGLSLGATLVTTTVLGETLDAHGL